MNQQSILKPDDTIAALSYELNAAALTVAAEAERLGSCTSLVADANAGGDIGLTGRIHFLIAQLHETALLLRYARHSGYLPPLRSGGITYHRPSFHAACDRAGANRS